MTEARERIGEFTVLRKIGEGGMAEVYLAEQVGDEDFRALVALKRLHSGFSVDQYFIRQLVQEAKLLGQLQHNNIVRVANLRRIDDEYYIVMEYIDGIDLAEAIEVHRDNGLHMPLSIFFHVAISLCEALDYAHNAVDIDGQPMKLIHRDIKPSNVLISSQGVVKLTDFGIARVGDATNTGSVVKGTANYMSPEQASGDVMLTASSDIFSLGALYWEMLTLHKLVDGTNYLHVIGRIKDLNVGLKDITKKGIEPGLRMILLRMLARKRQLRYQNMSLVLKDLRFVADQLKVDLTPEHLREYMGNITSLAQEASKRKAAMRPAASRENDFVSVDDYPTNEDLRQTGPGKAQPPAAPTGGIVSTSPTEAPAPAAAAPAAPSTPAPTTPPSAPPAPPTPPPAPPAPPTPPAPAAPPKPAPALPAPPKPTPPKPAPPKPAPPKPAPPKPAPPKPAPPKPAPPKPAPPKPAPPKPAPIRQPAAPAAAPSMAPPQRPRPPASADPPRVSQTNLPLAQALSDLAMKAAADTGPQQAQAMRSSLGGASRGLPRVPREAEATGPFLRPGDSPQPGQPLGPGSAGRNSGGAALRASGGGTTDPLDAELAIRQAAPRPAAPKPAAPALPTTRLSGDYRIVAEPSEASRDPLDARTTPAPAPPPGAQRFTGSQPEQAPQSRPPTGSQLLVTRGPSRPIDHQSAPAQGGSQVTARPVHPSSVPLRPGPPPRPAPTPVPQAAPVPAPIQPAAAPAAPVPAPAAAPQQPAYPDRAPQAAPLRQPAAATAGHPPSGSQPVGPTAVYPAQAAQPPTPADDYDDDYDDLEAGKRRNRMVLWSGGVASLVIVFAIAWVITRPGSEPQVEPAPETEQLTAEPSEPPVDEATSPQEAAPETTFADPDPEPTPPPRRPDPTPRSQGSWTTDPEPRWEPTPRPEPEDDNWTLKVEPETPQEVALVEEMSLAEMALLDSHALAGDLSLDDLDRLEAVSTDSPGWFKSRALLLAHYEANADTRAHCAVAQEATSERAGEANPQLNIELARCHLRMGRYDSALTAARAAELNAQDIPSRTRADKQLHILKLQAQAHKGLYQQDDDLRHLEDAVAVWRRYEALANKLYRSQEAQEARTAIAKLQDLMAGAL